MVNMNKSSKINYIIAGVSAFVLLLFVGGGVAAYKMWYQNPEKVLTDALVHAMDAKTASFTGSFEAQPKNDGSGVESLKKLTVSVDGANTTDASKLSAKLTIAVTNKTYTIVGAAQRDKDANLYVEIDDIKKHLTDLLSGDGEGYASMPQSVQNIIAKIDSKWVRVAPDDMKDMTQDSSKVQQCTSDVYQKFKNDKKQMQEVADVYKKNKFVAVKEKLAAKQGSLGYVVDLNQNQLKSFIKDVNNTTIVKNLKECDKQFNFDENSIDLKKNDENNSRVEVWVTRWSHQFSKVAVTTDDKKLKTSTVVQPTFDKPVAIDAPRDYVKFSEVKELIQKVNNEFTGGYDSAYSTAEFDTGSNYNDADLLNQA